MLVDQEIGMEVGVLGLWEWGDVGKLSILFLLAGACYSWQALTLTSSIFEFSGRLKSF